MSPPEVNISFSLKDDVYYNINDQDYFFEPYINPFRQYGDVDFYKDSERSLTIVITLDQNDGIYVEENQTTHHDIARINDEIHSIFYGIDIVGEYIDKANIYNFDDLDVIIEPINASIKIRIITIGFFCYTDDCSLELLIESINKALNTYGCLSYEIGTTTEDDHWVSITIEKYFTY
jgi:hypothetical protein